MVILTLLDDDDIECCGYEVRSCSKKGRGVFATKGETSDLNSESSCCRTQPNDDIMSSIK